jgi:hypothetical protein
VERLRAGERHGHVALLPLPSELPAGVTWSVKAAAAASPTDVMVVAHGFDNPEGDRKTQRFSYAARWDGQSWRLDGAAPQWLSRVWTLDGHFAAVDEQGTLWLERAGAWLEVEWRGDEAGAEKPGELAQLLRVGREAWLVTQKDLPEGALSSRIYRVEVDRSERPGFPR